MCLWEDFNYANNCRSLIFDDFQRPHSGHLDSPCTSRCSLVSGYPLTIIIQRDMLKAAGWVSREAALNVNLMASGAITAPTRLILIVDPRKT